MFQSYLQLSVWGLPCTTYCWYKGGEQCADDYLKETSAVENYEETDDEEEYSE